MIPVQYHTRLHLAILEPAAFNTGSTPIIRRAGASEGGARGTQMEGFNFHLQVVQGLAITALIGFTSFLFCEWGKGGEVPFEGGCRGEGRRLSIWGCGFKCLGSESSVQHNYPIRTQEGPNGRQDDGKSTPSYEQCQVEWNQFLNPKPPAEHYRKLLSKINFNIVIEDFENHYWTL